MWEKNLSDFQGCGEILVTVSHILVTAGEKTLADVEKKNFVSTSLTRKRKPIKT